MKSEKIAASICWLTAALLFAVDQINLHLTYLSLATLGYSTDIGYIDSVPMVVLAVVFVLDGIGFLVSEKFKKH